MPLPISFKMNFRSFLWHSKVLQIVSNALDNFERFVLKCVTNIRNKMHIIWLNYIQNHNCVDLMRLPVTGWFHPWWNHFCCDCSEAIFFKQRGYCLCLGSVPDPSVFDGVFAWWMLAHYPSGAHFYLHSEDSLTSLSQVRGWERL